MESTPKARRVKICLDLLTAAGLKEPKMRKRHSLQGSLLTGTSKTYLSKCLPEGRQVMIFPQKSSNPLTRMSEELLKTLRAKHPQTLKPKSFDKAIDVEFSGPKKDFCMTRVCMRSSAGWMCIPHKLLSRRSHRELRKAHYSFLTSSFPGSPNKVCWCKAHRQAMWAGFFRGVVCGGDAFVNEQVYFQSGANVSLVYQLLPVCSPKCNDRCNLAARRELVGKRASSCESQRIFGSKMSCFTNMASAKRRYFATVLYWRRSTTTRSWSKIENGSQLQCFAKLLACCSIPAFTPCQVRNIKLFDLQVQASSWRDFCQNGHWGLWQNHNHPVRENLWRWGRVCIT